MILEKYLEQAKSAGRNVYSDPERVGTENIKSYSAELESDLQEVKKFEGDIERYQAKYESLFAAWLTASGNCFHRL